MTPILISYTQQPGFQVFGPYHDVPVATGFVNAKKNYKQKAIMYAAAVEFIHANKGAPVLMDYADDLGGLYSHLLDKCPDADIRGVSQSVYHWDMDVLAFGIGIQSGEGFAAQRMGVWDRGAVLTIGNYKLKNTTLPGLSCFAEMTNSTGGFELAFWNGMLTGAEPSLVADNPLVRDYKDGSHLPRCWQPWPATGGLEPITRVGNKLWKQKLMTAEAIETDPTYPRELTWNSVFEFEGKTMYVRKVKGREVPAAYFVIDNKTKAMDKVKVLPQFRHLGLGKSMVEAAIAAGATNLVCRDSLVEWYETFGFSMARRDPRGMFNKMHLQGTK